MYVVSSLFDLASREGTPRQNIADYVQLGRPLLERLTQDHDVIVFVEPELVEVVRDAVNSSPRLHLVPCRLEDMPAYADLDDIKRARRERPLLRFDGPVRNIKDTALYNVFQRTKLHLLERAIELTPDATHMAWVDFGVCKIAPVESIPLALDAAMQLDRVQICHHYDLCDPGEPMLLRQNVAAGFIAGPVDKIGKFAAGFDERMQSWLAMGVTPHDETALELVALAMPKIVIGRIIKSHATMFSDCAKFGWEARVRDDLLGLVMIVKNEAHNIEQTLASFRSVIDRWTILDTGSTDGTQDVIRRELAGIPGELHEEPFVDFSTSRNRALELHGTSTVFAVMPDSDDYLVNADELRTFLQGRRREAGVSDEAYGLNLRRGHLSYYLPLVMRTSAGWRYSGRVHECSGRPGGAPFSAKVPGVQLCQQQPKPQSMEASRARWHRDLELLMADVASNPQDPRALFYLAQTYECLGRPREALTTYERRIEVGGWYEETFEAKLRRAKILDVLKRWHEAESAFLDAHQFDSRRAEPLFHIANHYYQLDQHALVYLFASRALALPRPDTTLFVDADVYEWKVADLVAISGFYLGQREPECLKLGASAADLAVKGNPHNDRLRNNRAFYARSASETFNDCYVSREIEWRPELPYRAMNPSVHFDGDKWRCIVRTVNYHIVNGQYLTPDDNVIYTRNWMLELAPESLAVERAVEMVDRDPTPRSSFPVHGFEDCRLFSVGGQLYATSTACDMNDASGNREIVLLELGKDYGIDKATPLRGPWSGRHQKNWMPLVNGDRVRFIYSTLPEVVLDGLRPEARGTPNLAYGAYGRLRGGSQAVRVPGGWLFLVHDVTFMPGRVYLHRWVLMDDELKVAAMSDAFFFQRLGIEFCAGLAFNSYRKMLVASFSVNDESAHLGVFDLGDVMESLRDDFVV